MHNATGHVVLLQILSWIYFEEKEDNSIDNQLYTWH